MHKELHGSIEGVASRLELPGTLICCLNFFFKNSYLFIHFWPKFLICPLKSTLSEVQKKSKEQRKASRQKSNTSYLKSHPKLDIP